MTNSGIAATRGKHANCCTAAPDVLEFDPAGNLIRHWGKAEGHDWPTSNHGITVDSKGNVWLGANGAGQPGPPAGSAAAPGRGAAPAPWRREPVLLKQAWPTRRFGPITTASS